MNKLILFMAVICIFYACKKDITNSVYIRIQNTTETSFSGINIGNVTYGQLPSQKISDYKLIKEPVYAAACEATITDSSFYIGFLICGSPMPPAFENGKYTFIIQGSVSAPGYYELQMKKD